MAPALATFLFELVNFLLLALLLGWLLFKPIRAFLEARRQAMDEQTAALRARETEIGERQAKLKERTAAFEASIDGEKQTRLEAARREGEAIVAEARASAARERERATRAMSQIEQNEIEQLADTVASVARDVVAALLDRLKTPGLDDSLLDAGLRQLGAVAGDALGSVRVESAHPLAEGRHQAVVEALRERAASLDFAVVPDLGAGVRITTARGVIDASASGIAAEAQRRFKDALAPPSSERVG